MKVLHVFKDYYPPTFGGIEQHINDVVHSIPEIRFGVLTSSRTRRLIHDDDHGVNVVRAPEYLRPVSTPITPSWSRLLRNSGTDLFHFHVPNPFGELMFLTSRARAPMVATYHADIIGRKALIPFFAPFLETFLKKARSIIVSSPRLAESSRTLRSHRDRCVVIPFGVDPASWSEPPAMTEVIRQRYPGPLFVFLGRMAYYKGLDVLIRAMQGVDATCLLIGTGPLEIHLLYLVEQMGLTDKVIFIGDVSDDHRAAYYHAATAFVLPSTSRAETFGISMLESMACGTPAISTEVQTGTSWVNQNRRTGLVVPPGDPAALAGALKTLLADPGRTQEMGFAASERVREHFSKSRMLQSLSSLYSSI